MTASSILGALDDGIDLRPVAVDGGLAYAGTVDGQPASFTLRDRWWQFGVGDRWTAEGDGAAHGDAGRIIRRCVAEWRAARLEGSA